MFIKRTGLLLLLLAYLVMLGHAMIPHHHHSGEDDLAHHHQEAHHHNHSEVPAGDLGLFFTHLVHADIISTNTPAFRFVPTITDTPLLLAVYLNVEFHFANDLEAAKLFEPPPEPFLLASFVISRYGFRAPPFAVA